MVMAGGWLTIDFYPQYIWCDLIWSDQSILILIALRESLVALSHHGIWPERQNESKWLESTQEQPGKAKTNRTHRNIAKPMHWWNLWGHGSPAFIQNLQQDKSKWLSSFSKASATSLNLGLRSPSSNLRTRQQKARLGRAEELFGHVPTSGPKQQLDPVALIRQC